MVPDIGKRARSRQLTALESRSVSAEIQNQYRSYYMKFEAFCRDNAIPFPPSLGDADPTLADFLDILYLDGKSASEGEKTVASVEFHNIHLKGHLPRSRRALRGWRKSMPPSSRLPLPRLAMFGIAMNLAAKGHLDRALMVIAGFNMYLRPGEALDLRKKNFVPPVKKAGRQFKHTTVIIRDRDEGKPDKIGVFDNSLAIDGKAYHSSWGTYF